MQRVWHRSRDGWWYATLREAGRREQIKLLKAADTPDARKRAEDCLVRELAARIERGEAPEGSPEWQSVAHVIAGFLAHSAQEHDKDAHRWYKGMLSGFSVKWGTIRVATLRKQQVLSFIKAKYDNPTSQNKAIGAIKRAFNWAVEEEHIARNPIAHVRKPKPVVSRSKSHAVNTASTRNSATASGASGRVEGI